LKIRRSSSCLMMPCYTLIIRGGCWWIAVNLTRHFYGESVLVIRRGLGGKKLILMIHYYQSHHQISVSSSKSFYFSYHNCWNCTLTNACRPISSFIKKSVHLLGENSLDTTRHFLSFFLRCIQLVSVLKLLQSETSDSTFILLF